MIKHSYVITSPRNLHKDPNYRNRSGGVRVLDLLAKELQNKGYNAYLVDTGKTDDKVANELIDKQGAIAVYHECINANYLNAKVFVPYIMGLWKLGNNPGLGILNSDVKFYHSLRFQNDEYKSSAKEHYKLTFDFQEKDLFNNPSDKKRTYYVYYRGKGTALDLNSLNLDAPVLQITDNWPATRSEMADLFKSAKLLYTTDANSATADEARVCGCPVVFVPNQIYSIENCKLLQMSLSGMALGNSQAEIDKAQNTVVQYAEDRKLLFGNTDVELDKFIEVTQRLANEKMPIPVKKKILMCGFDNPTMDTGYASTCNAIASGLIAKGHTLYTISGNWELKDSFIFNGINVLSNTGSLYPTKETFLKHYYAVQPDICLFHNDMYRINFVPDLDYSIRKKSIVWLPIEKITVNDINTLRACEKVEHMVVVSDYASRELSLKTGRDIETIYHQVDCDTFRPLPDKQFLKNKYNVGNKFVVLRNDRNQPRKLWSLTLRVWEKFCKDKNDVILYAKTKPQDMTGKDLYKEATELNIPNNKIIFHPAQVPKETLNEVYNCADVFLSTTGAEGFGLGLAEACAVGLPVLATDTAPVDEVLDYGKCGKLLKVSGQTYNQTFKVNYDAIDIDYAVACLNEFYVDWKKGSIKANEIGKHSREYALSRYNVKKIVDSWDKYFDEVMLENFSSVEYKMALRPYDRLEVGIVTKDRHTHLVALLTSLLNQTYRNFDLHIIDNSDNESLGSNDAVRKLLDLLGQQGHIWKLWKNSNPNMNCHDTLYEIVKNTSCSFVFRADDDVILDKDCLYNLMSVIKSDDKIGAVGPIYHQGKTDKCEFISNIRNLNDNTQWHIIQKNTEVEHLYSGFLFRKELFENTQGLSRLAFREDTLSSYKIKKKGYKLIVVKDALAYHLNGQSGNRAIDVNERSKMAQWDETIFVREINK